ncbi:hypothetical protein COV18_02020 [Candidatus Woesearchaeota archaeon CG10_big_fil_rev_8_21_14_0_10_37_12]|nr:MAG: hypothetical protein COV18_02020 [Candidatus Woesearchaeota archaeon CG10_big_fil_rev_8_21_14_0_10_37_12]
MAHPNYSCAIHNPMTTTNPKLVEQALDFLRNITKKDKIAIVHDTDPDGICSAVIVAKFIERYRGKKIEIHMPLNRKMHGFTDDMFTQFKQANITKIITTDFPAGEHKEMLQKFSKKFPILVIDHHRVYLDKPMDNVILYNPHLFSTIEPARYCTGKLAYDLISQITNISDLDWVAATASIADIAHQPWMHWIKQTFEKYNYEFKEELFKTTIGDVAITISSTEVYDEKLVNDCFNLLYDAKTPQEFTNSKLKKYREIIDKEIYKHLDNFEKNAERYNDLLIYSLESKYRVKSPIATILGQKYKNKTIILISENKETKTISVSARRSDKKIDTGKLLETTIKNFKDSTGGGHPAASAAIFPAKYLGEFKQLLIKEYQNEKTKTT